MYLLNGYLDFKEEAKYYWIVKVNLCLSFSVLYEIYIF